MPLVNDEEVRKSLDAERERLQKLRAGVENVTQELEQDASLEVSSVDQHPADLGTETFERTKDLAIIEQLDVQLTEVEHAFHRLEEGTYGKCEACGNPIGDERLEALPAARFCVKDQAEAERRSRTG